VKVRLLVDSLMEDFRFAARMLAKTAGRRW
jgi:hypothetical protein